MKISSHHGALSCAQVTISYANTEKVCAWLGPPQGTFAAPPRLAYDRLRDDQCTASTPATGIDELAATRIDLATDASSIPDWENGGSLRRSVIPPRRSATELPLPHPQQTSEQLSPR
jgi:hypothetical protein